MEDIVIKYHILFNVGEHKGKTLEIDILLEDIEISDLAGVLIDEGYIETYSNSLEFEIIKREVL